MHEWTVVCCSSRGNPSGITRHNGSPIVVLDFSPRMTKFRISLTNLFGLEILWLEGKCSFQDSLLTCLWMQCPNAAENAGAHDLALFCMALSVACGLVSDLVRDARCTAFPEDFRPNLGVYAQRHLAGPLLKRLNCAHCLPCPTTAISLHFARLAAWLGLLHESQTIALVIHGPAQSLQRLIHHFIH